MDVLKTHENEKNFGNGCLITLGFRKRNRRGQSMVEFSALMIFILVTFIVFQKYIVRGFSGRWKGVGDALGQGRIYDPERTTACDYYPTVGWFNRTCYEEKCQSTFGTPANAEDCIASSQCRTQICDQ